MKKLLLFTALALLIIPAQAQTTNTAPAADAAPIDPNSEIPALINAGPPPKALPSVPGWGYWPKVPMAWLQTHHGLAAQSKNGGVDVAFMGDSITQGWGANGKAMWDRDFAPLKAANYGIGGDTTRQVLWRINHGAFEGINPKLVVLAIGTNNLYGDQNGGTDQEIADGDKAIVDLILSKFPNTKILLVGMLPREKQFNPMIAHINSLVAKLANGTTIQYLDPNKDQAFVDSPSKVKDALYTPEHVHLTPAGYEVFASYLKPAVDDMLK